jgi:hypothetical protein
MINNRVKFNLILENLVPEYVREEFPLVLEFLKEYYKSIENQGQTLDLLQNIDKYVQIDNITNLIDSTNLVTDITFFDDEIYVESIQGFPKRNGLLQIDSEVIFYEKILEFQKVENINIIIPTNSNIVYPIDVIGSLSDYAGCLLRIKDEDNNIIKIIKIDSIGSGLSLILSDIPFISDETFESEYVCEIVGSRFIGCKRGFSGVTSYTSINAIDKLTFSESESNDHIFGSIVKNLSILFLKEFFRKIKYQIAPGFQNIEFFGDLNESTFVKNIREFYTSKGTDCSFELLFRALFGSDVEIIKPRDYLIIPSDAQYRVFRNIIVESVNGDPRKLANRTLYQDQFAGINPAKGIVSKVEKVQKDSKDYYIISLDNTKENSYDLIFGNFSIHPKTKVTFESQIGSSYIDVDSTIGFPESGELVVEYENQTSDIITYKSKTSTQFLECEGITQSIPLLTDVKLNTFVYSIVDGETISVRIVGVISDLDLIDNSYYNKIGDEIEVKTLGIELDDVRSENWFFNIPVSYDVSSVSILDNNENQKDYEVILFDKHILKIGDPITLSSSLGQKSDGLVISFINEKTVAVRIKDLLDPSLKYILNKNISKVDSSNYKSLNQYSSNVQNVYSDANNEIYVNSQSLPNYLYEPLTINDNSIVFSGSYNNTEELNIGPHNFYTGDSVIYKPGEGSNKLNIEKGIYFVKRVNSTTIKLSRSRNNIYTNINFLRLSGDVVNNKLEFTKFNFPNLETKLLEPQNILRKITPDFDKSDSTTLPGTIGILVNGVELLNYKSNDQIFYGEIKSIIPSSEGSGYDVINPPDLIISDPIGFGAQAYCAVNGSLDRIDIVDPGFDYLEVPKIQIAGGNGTGASAVAELVNYNYSVNFDISNVNVITDTIGFSTYHNFRTGEVVKYLPLNNIPVSGLTTNSIYYISVIDNLNIKLHKSFEDSVSGINTLPLSNVGGKYHRLTSENLKRKLGSIRVVNGGKNYQNKKRICYPTGINTYSDTILINNHGYSSGEIITYNSTQGSPIGLTSSTSYYVTKINDNEFKLSQIGISTLGISTSFYYETRQYVKLSSQGAGKHIFNYPKIEVTISGKVGTYSTVQTYQAKIQPIFSGKIESVFIEDGGNSYGSNEILNYTKQPEIKLLTGTDAQVEPIISDGKIVDVIIKNPGKNYYSTPKLEITGSGSGCILTPVVKFGVLFEVKIISSGAGYNNQTKIDVIPPGIGAKFEASIQSWRINIVERIFRNNTITSDDGVIYEGKGKNSSLEYTHLYAPRKLRSSVFGTRTINGSTIYSQDLELIDGKESDSVSHSPIIGWAYDGNPIYGPYGYSSITGGSVKQMIPGYELVIKDNRPNLDLYPLGIFIEDYEFLNTGDLDKHNGRYCITPEFPNGTYAYFSTFNTFVETREGSLFNKYKKPAFPYLIGNTYKSNPIKFNISINSNLNKFDLNKEKWLRNTKPYSLLNKNTYYNFIQNSDKNRRQISIVEQINSGKIDSVGIITGGYDYKVGDKLIVDDTNTSGFGFNASVSSIKGIKLLKVESATEIIDDVEILFNNSKLISFSTSPHNLFNNDIVTINSKYDFNARGLVKLTQNNLVLTTGIGSTLTTGIITYLNVSGNLNYPNVRENDVYQIDQEKVKILAIDKNSSRIKVLREFDNSVGVNSAVSGSILTEKTRKFEIRLNSSGLSTESILDVNKEIYFDPNETIGIGTTSGVGITSTIYFSNPGVGITFISIPTKSLYLPEHNLETGDELTYSTNNGSSILVSLDGINGFSLPNDSKVYVSRISSNLIGISTDNNNTLYFLSSGSGINHSFKTNYKNIFKGRVSKTIVTSTTDGSHNLLLNDEINLKIQSKTIETFKVRYNKNNRRLLINPINFLSSAVNVDDNTIRLPNHGLRSGQKIIYTSSSPSLGLVNNEIYYVINVSSDDIGLSSTLYDSTKNFPSFINIESSSSGTISPINPKINITKNNQVIFDLSDSSLSFKNNSFDYSAFKFTLYTDSNFSNEFETSEKNTIFNVRRFGKVGIDTDARLVIDSTENIDGDLFYNLTPINLKINDKENIEIISDTDVIEANKISFNESLLNGNHTIVGISTTSFNFNLIGNPEKSEYNTNNSSLYYTTNSKNCSGEISDIKIFSGGSNYKSVPFVKSISSDNGYGAVLKLNSKSIGSILKTKKLDVSFDYSSDFTIRPTSIQPLLFEVENISLVDNVEVLLPGKNYTIPPKLILIDGYTNKIIEDLELDYDIRNRKVTIIKNTLGISDYIPKIIPVNNSNGIDIRNISYNNITKNVTVILNPGFSREQDFPFDIGDKVFIENISVGISSDGKGYNSSDYDYQLFEITSVDKNIGGSGGSVTYNISKYLSGNDNPGQFDSFNSSGKIIPEKYLPSFRVNTKKKEFYINESIESGSSKGKIQSIDLFNNILKISSKDKFNPGDILKGTSSNSVAQIKSVTTFNSVYNINSNFMGEEGWERETGFLNNTTQRIHDSNYYQYFSYDLKSNIDYETWNPYVSNLNHTSGFKKFGSLVIDSKSDYTGISTEQNQSDFVGISHINQIVDLNCYHDFDLVKENNITINNESVTDQIIFNSKFIQDYIESIGNRVLVIDDLSDTFNSNPRSDIYSVVDSFDLENIYKKYFIFIRDKVFVDFKQSSMVSLIQNNEFGYLSQYGVVGNISDLGYFEFRRSGSFGNLLFFPKKFDFGSYDVSYISFDLYNTITGIGQTSFGNDPTLITTQTNVTDGVTTKIVGIPTSYKGSKVLVHIRSYDDTIPNDAYYEVHELTLLHNDVDVSVLEYGQFNTSSLLENSGVGIATYNAYISNNELILDIKTNVGSGVSFVVNTSAISIGNDSPNTVSYLDFREGTIASGSIFIAANSLPFPSVAVSMPNNCETSYIISLVHDLTNNEYSISEIITLKDEISGELLVTEYGILNTDTNIGVYSADNTYGTDSYNLLFTPNPNIDVKVTYFQMSLGRFDDAYNNPNILDLNNYTLSSGYGEYFGTSLDIRKEFNLTYKGSTIFEKVFNASSSEVVNINDSSVLLSYHFFTTGEEIEYRYNNSDTSSENAIEITPTFISGIGVTDKLPTTLYIVKDSDIKVRVSASASQSLQSIPDVLNFTNLGIGTEHKFISKKRNEKSLIAIDNVIQSPIVSTSTTAGLTTSMSRINLYLSVDDSEDLFGGDLIKVNNEIMLIRAVDSPIKNVLLVDRSLLGTGISSHPKNSTVFKVKGNYNIVDNKIYFSEAPFGKVPVSNPNARFDEIDYFGLEISSRFNGRVFLRSGISNSNDDTYINNKIIDDISSEFNTIKSTFELKYDSSNITGISTDNAIVLVNSAVQYPELSYVLTENAGITTIKVNSPESTTYDSRIISLPKGGIILSVGSSEGFGYQPLVSAGGKPVVSSSGTIQSILINNTGSGYRPGIQTSVNVSVLKTDSSDYESEVVGIASIINGEVVSVTITNPGSGYTSTNPPDVVFDPPYSYTDIPLVYSNDSGSIGIGTEATVNIIVGQSSNVVDFEFKNLGYGYKKGDVLTIDIGGQTGIPTTSNFVEFKIFVDSIFSDSFSAWTVGGLQILDSFEDLFDGTRKRFPISIDGNLVSIVSKKGSNIDIQSTLLVFVNDILQVPGEGYVFNGGSIIEFTESPKPEDKCSIIFYTGTSNVDTFNFDILETVKIGDELTINSDDPLYQEKTRIIESITNVDTTKTNFYNDQGIDRESTRFRPVLWCKQTEDKIINGNYVGKDRVYYEPYIYPTTNIIQNVGLGTDIIFVESVKTFFDSEKEYFHNGVNEKPQNKIIIISQDSVTSAAATAIVSSSGTISSIIINDGGIGYSTDPSISISNPIGLGTTGRAQAQSFITNGSVSSVSISTGGFGYDQMQPPEILFESPSPKYEILDNISYEGDFGVITGISTISVGAALTGIVFDLFIPQDSVLRDTDIVKVGIATTGISGIQTGYYFIVKNSNLGNGLKSLDLSGNVLSIGNSFIDNTYQVASVSIAQTSVPGIGITYVAKVIVGVSSYNNLTGLGFSDFYGEYSWGRISSSTEKTENEFISYGYNGISTSPVIQRFNRLKYIGYSTT